jgi:Ca2+-transporting ATPase
MMAVVLRSPNDGAVMYTKGAPEVVLARCDRELRSDGTIKPLSPSRGEELLRVNADLSVRAMRVLGLACRPVDPGRASIEERGLIFSGLVGMIDRPARRRTTPCGGAETPASGRS